MNDINNKGPFLPCHIKESYTFFFKHQSRQLEIFPTLTDNIKHYMEDWEGTLGRFASVYKFRKGHV